MEALVRAAQEDFRDSVTTMNSKGKCTWLFPLKPKGKLYNARTYVSLVFLAIFFLLPFINVNGDPIFLFNVLERKFILFGIIFWPQDFFLLGLAMLTFMVFIVLFTVVFGRLWCGWACPQTIFMEMVFRKIEYWIEGDSNQQKILDKSPWNLNKIQKRSLKYIVFFTLSLIFSITFLSYIIGLTEVIKIANEPLSGHVGALISLLIFSGIFFFVFTWFREQVCIVVCPYGRLQGVLLDKNSIVVAYDYKRGEPRGKFKKNDLRAKGDCIDCFQCVKVCPTGIDIRNGTQLECINCTACIDACDNMMKKTNRPKGLIRYASEKGIAEGIPLKLTSRIIGYAAVLFILMISLGFALYNRSEVETSILRTPGMLYQDQGDNNVSNLYNVKILNKSHHAISATFKLENIKGEIRMIGKKKVDIRKGWMGESEFFVILDRINIVDRKTKIRIGIYSGNKRVETITTTFMGPVGKKKYI